MVIAQAFHVLFAFLDPLEVFLYEDGLNQFLRREYADMFPDTFAQRPSFAQFPAQVP